MKFPWSKRKRGTYRSAKQRAQEEQSTIDLMMLQTWRDDLRQHPEYMREIARQKFGMSDMGEGENRYEEPDFISKIHEVVDAKSSLDSLFGGSGGGVTGGLMGMLNSIIQQDKDGEVAKAVAGLINLITGKVGQPQLAQQPQQQIAQPEQPQLPEPKTEKERMIKFAEHFLALQPEQVALHLYQRRETEGTVESFLWNSIIGLSVDDVLAMVPILDNSSYSYLVPLAQSLSKPSRRQWLGLVLDECNRLGSGEIELPENDKEDLI